MLSRQWLCGRRCVRDLIQVLDGATLRAAGRGPIPLDDPTVGLLLFWTILRGERTFLLRSLEQLGVDMWALTCDVDDLLQRKRFPPNDPRAASCRSDLSYEHLEGELEEPLWAWVDWAEQQAIALGHPYVGTEHLLLAIVAGADESLAAVLARHRLDYQKLADTVHAALAAPDDAATAERERMIAQANQELSTTAVGVPRRFSLATLMLTMVTYAMLLGALRMGGTPVEAIVVLLVLFTAAGVGQPILYGGRNPRRASVVIGLVLFPLEILALIVYLNTSGTYRIGGDEAAAFLILALLGGGVLGYAAGCLAAGMFYLNDRYEKFKQRHAASEPSEPDPLARDD